MELFTKPFLYISGPCNNNSNRLLYIYTPLLYCSIIALII